MATDETDFAAQVRIAKTFLWEAIGSGNPLPSEFKTFVDQHMEPAIANLATYQDRSAIAAKLGLGKGIINGAMPLPQLMKEGETPERAIIRLLTPFPTGDVATQIPNLYRGPLDDHEPRMQGPASAWKI